MLKQIKYRVLGAVVLIGLLLIIVPMLFDNVVRYQTITPPAPPAMPTVVIAKQPSKPVVTPPSVDKTLPPLKAYTIQVTSFKEVVTVDHLIASLQKDGFTAYSRQSKKSGFTTVFVGHVLTKDQADAVSLQLAKKYQVKPVVTSYSPVEG